MIFTSQQRFKKNKAPTTKTVPFNDEPVYRPLNIATPITPITPITPTTTTTGVFSPEVATKNIPTPHLRGPMIRTIAGEGRRSCCGGAV